mmetsp:Transcript_32570/g.49807  ORF Transcript_32570/g.49807 Transcript_32570/m.49807 type:complete len:88 (+) Transcript_32570:172-435(+)
MIDRDSLVLRTRAGGSGVIVALIHEGPLLRRENLFMLLNFREPEASLQVVHFFISRSFKAVLILSTTSSLIRNLLAPEPGPRKITIE